MDRPEEREQQAVMEWAAWMQGKYPELRRLYHIPNGGKRDKATAAVLKSLGVKPGVPDLCLPVPRGGYHGLYIEMKAVGGRPAAEQREWLEELHEQGYRAAVCVGADAAIAVIEGYLQGMRDEESTARWQLCREDSSDSRSRYWRCSACRVFRFRNGALRREYRYCPHCGRKIAEESSETDRKENRI